MSCFDTFVAPCPNCGKETESQTKLTDCLLNTFTPGSAVPTIGNCKIRVKSACECGYFPVAVITNGTFVGFEIVDPDIEEGVGGVIFEPGTRPKNDSLLDYIE